jgi:hypothetical protein
MLSPIVIIICEHSACRWLAAAEDSGVDAPRPALPASNRGMICPVGIARQLRALLAPNAAPRPKPHPPVARAPLPGDRGAQSRGQAGPV